MNQKLSLALYSVAIGLMLTGLKGYVNYISFVLILFAITLNYFGNKGVRKKNKSVKCFIIFIAYYLLTSLIHLDVAYCATYTSYYIMSFSGIFFAQSLIESGKREEIKKWLAIALILWFAIAIQSIRFYINDPGAARRIAVNREDYANSIFGGYQLAFGCAILLVYLLYYFKSLNLKGKIALFAAEAILFANIYLTESSLTTFATVLGIIGFAFFHKTTGDKSIRASNILPFILFTIISCTLYYLIQIYSYDISIYLEENKDLVISRRLTEIINRTYYDEASDHYSVRVDTLTYSMKMFFTSPLIGHGYKYGYVFYKGTEYGIGNHSGFLDALAVYGLMGAIPLFGVYFYAMKEYLSRNIPLIVTFSILVIFNPFLSFQSNLPVFYLIPLFEYLKNTNPNLNNVAEEKNAIPLPNNPA